MYLLLRHQAMARRPLRVYDVVQNSTEKEVRL